MTETCATENAGHPLGRVGDLTVRLAANSHEVRQAQRLRFRVFVDEMGASVPAQNRATGIDEDAFDAFSRHLIVKRSADVVGTTRLLDRETAGRAGGFYSQGEFDIAPLLSAYSGQPMLEPGRSCIAADHRNRRTAELLWHGIWSVALQDKSAVMFGCASLPDADAAAHADRFALLAQSSLAAPALACDATSGEAIALGDYADRAVDTKRVFATLPPLLKGYLRLGANVSHQAVPDHAFNTTDLLVILDIASINPRYLTHFGADAGRFRSR